MAHSLAQQNSCSSCSWTHRRQCSVAPIRRVICLSGPGTDAQRGPGQHAPAVEERSPPSTPAISKADSKPLSPAGFLPNASGVSVQGYSPTSPQGWKLVKQTLRDADVKMLSAQEVVFAKERGVPIIDIRPADEYEKGHIPGAVNVPFFQPITGWEPIKVARRFGYALFGVLKGTEVNPNFVQQTSELVDDEKGAILYCNIGGTLDPTESSKRGLQSRSLIAAWQLVDGGVTNISVMKGGIKEWIQNGRDVEEIA